VQDLDVSNSRFVATLNIGKGLRGVQEVRLSSPN
jgi:hypothetical protein